MVKLRRVKSQHRVNEISNWVKPSDYYSSDRIATCSSFPVIALSALGIYGMAVLDKLHKYNPGISDFGEYSISSNLQNFHTYTYSVPIPATDNRVSYFNNFLIEVDSVLRSYKFVLRNTNPIPSYEFLIHYKPYKSEQSILVFTFGYNSNSEVLYAKSQYSDSISRELSIKSHYSCELS